MATLCALAAPALSLVAPAWSVLPHLGASPATPATLLTGESEPGPAAWVITSDDATAGTRILGVPAWWLGALWLGGSGWIAYAALAVFACHLAWQISRIVISDSALCLRLFKSNRDAGLLLFAGLVIDAVLRSV